MDWKKEKIGAVNWSTWYRHLDLDLHFKIIIHRHKNSNDWFRTFDFRGDNLDLLKLLCFSFSVLVVGPSTKDFYPMQPRNPQEEFSSCGFYQITIGFTDAPSIKRDHATWNVTRTVLTQIELFTFYGLSYNCIQLQSRVQMCKYVLSRTRSRMV